MRIYGDLMGIYGDLLGIYGDLMGYEWDVPSGNDQHSYWKYGPVEILSVPSQYGDFP